MPTVPTTRDAIRASLRADGPMTAADIAQQLGRPKGTITSTIHCARRHGSKHIRIAGYERSLGTSGRIKPLYACGPGRDAKPAKPLTRAEVARRYNHAAGRVWGIRRRHRERPELAWMAALL